ncbi:MAG: alpha/beta hydrolase, partial [Myxococcales bacterium]|nr:alpha/beta hydrolase [Myxococcales bacterium]
RVFARCDAAVQQALPLEALAALWPGFVGELGAFGGIGSVASERDASGSDVVTALLRFEQSPLELRLRLDRAGTVQALAVRPVAPPYEPPAYVDAARFEERELVVDSDLSQCGGACRTLPATLTLPKGPGPVPGVVLVHGSGPQDRDSTLGPNRPFKDLAWGLASRGIAVLRYVKRTKEHGPKLSPEEVLRLTLHEETVADALAAARTLRASPGVDPARVFVLGHSLGGFALPRIARQDPATAGFVSLAGSTRPFEDLVRDQLHYLCELDGKVSDAEQATLAALDAAVRRVKQLTPASVVAPADLPLSIAAPYWLDLAASPPDALLTAERRPFLVLQGGRDYQVTAPDFEGWKRALAADPRARFQLYPDLNHIFVAGTGPGSPVEYERAGHVAEEVVRDVAAFVLGGG